MMADHRSWYQRCRIPEDRRLERRIREDQRLRDRNHETMRPRGWNSETRHLDRPIPEPPSEGVRRIRAPGVHRSGARVATDTLLRVPIAMRFSQAWEATAPSGGSYPEEFDLPFRILSLRNVGKSRTS